mgnify:CR=1 FL=1
MAGTNQVETKTETEEIPPQELRERREQLLEGDDE